MEPQLYQQVLLAVQVSHSPAASSADRAAAYAFCEQFKTRGDCALYAVAIFRDPRGAAGDATSMEIHMRRHFALHVLGHYVLTRWSSLPPAEQSSLRSELVDLLLRSANSSSSSSDGQEDEPVFIREKKVALIAQMAKRQFPQRWPEFLPELLQIWQAGSPQQIELVIMVLRSLAEDCVSSSFNTSIPPARRKDILQGLNACLPQLFPVVYQELEKQYALFKAAPAASGMSQRLIHAALDMLKEFLDWMPFDRPVQPSTNLIMVAVLLLDDREFRLAAAECLEVYMSRGFGKDNRAIMLQSTAQIMEKVAALDLLTVQTSEMEDTLRFHKKVNDLLVAWGTYQLDTLLLEKGAQEMALLRAILEVLARLFTHPSVMIAEAQVVLWLNVLKNKAVLNAGRVTGTGDAFLADILATLRSTSFDKFFKLGSPDRFEDDDDGGETDTSAVTASERLVCEVSAEEFDDHHEYMTFFYNFRGRIYGLIRVLVQLSPTVMLEMLRDRVAFVLARFPAGTDHLTRDRRLCTERSTAFLYHEGVTALLECAIKQLPPRELENPVNRQLVQSLLQMIVAFETQDPQLKYRQMLVLSAFPKYYALDGAALTPVFDMLFTHINFVLPGEDVHEKMSTDTMNVRRRALSSLVTICNAIPAQILPVLPVLCTQVQELFVTDRVLESEAVLLYEILVLVSNSMESAEEREQFLQQVVSEPIARWMSPDVTALVASPQAIVSAIEATNGANNGSGSPSISTLMLPKKMLQTLTTLYGIAKRACIARSDLTSTGSASAAAGTRLGFASVWPLLLPNLAAVIRAQHALYSAEVKAAALQTSTACWLLSVSVDEVAQFLGGRHHLDEDEIAKLPPASRWSKWHRGVRDVTYHLMGVAVSQRGFYDSPDAAAAVWRDSLLSNMEVMEHRHLKGLLAYVVLPFIKTCPRQLYPTLLEPVLLKICRHFVDRAAVCFAKPVFVPSGEGAQSNGAAAPATPSKKTPWSALVVGLDETKQDVARDKMLADMVRQVMDLLESAVDAKTVVGVDTDNPKHVTQPEDAALRDFILRESRTLPFAVGAVLVQLICWKDSATCRRAVLLADKLVNMLHSEPALAEYFGRELFSAALQGLLGEHPGHEKEDALKWELINLARNIYCRLTLGLVPVDECKGIDPCNQPERPAELLCSLPRDVLLSLHGLTPELVADAERALRGNLSIKSQKNVIKELLEVPMQALKSARASSTGLEGMAGLFAGNDSAAKRIQDLPEKLVLTSKQQAAAASHAQWLETQDRLGDAGSLFGH